jgi:hypothetical protein
MWVIQPKVEEWLRNLREGGRITDDIVKALEEASAH